MKLKEATSRRIIELCNKYDYSPNKLAEISMVPPSTFNDMLNEKRDNPSSLIISKICKTLKIELKEFYDSDLFKNLDDWNIIIKKNNIEIISMHFIVRKELKILQRKVFLKPL